MANISYLEQLNAERTAKIREMLRSLPVSCTDFINSIAMTTSVLTRMAYTIDLQTFCGFATAPPSTVTHFSTSGIPVLR